MKKAFISVYSLFIVLAISIILVQSLKAVFSKSEDSLALLFQAQSHIYARVIKEMAILCIKDSKKIELIINNCIHDETLLDSYFMGEYSISKINLESKDAILLDILITSPNLLSTHKLSYSKRYIIKI